VFRLIRMAVRLHTLTPPPLLPRLEEDAYSSTLSQTFLYGSVLCVRCMMMRVRGSQHGRWLSTSACVRVCVCRGRRRGGRHTDGGGGARAKRRRVCVWVGAWSPVELA